MPLNFIEFIHLGRDQWRVRRSPLISFFFRILGPIGVHARIRNARVLQALEGIPLAGKQLIDFGSGYGYALHYLSERYPTASFEGIEIDPLQVADCGRIIRQKGIQNLVFRQGTSEDITCRECYDVVISIDVLEHVQEDEKMLATMARVLRPGGHAVIHVPLRHQLQRRILPVFRGHTVEDHVRDEYVPEEIQAKVESTGLRVLRIESGFGFWGELAFELNNLFWHNSVLHGLTALFFWPISMLAGYADARAHLKQGNSILLVAVKP